MKLKAITVSATQNEPIERHIQRERDYRAAMAPINADFARCYAMLPTRFLVAPDGKLVLDESYPPERAELLALHKRIAETVASSFSYEPLPVE